jgi:hypothetical protein
MRESYNQEVLRSEWKVCHAAIIDTKFCALCNKGTVFLLQTALHKAHHYLAQIHTSSLPLHFLSPHFAGLAWCCTKLSPTWFQLSTTYVRLAFIQVLWSLSLSMHSFACLSFVPPVNRTQDSKYATREKLSAPYQKIITDTFWQAHYDISG